MSYFIVSFLQHFISINVKPRWLHCVFSIDWLIDRPIDHIIKFLNTQRFGAELIAYIFIHSILR